MFESISAKNVVLNFGTMDQTYPNAKSFKLRKVHVDVLLYFYRKFFSNNLFKNTLS
jgi:hypothetical protein